MRIALGIQYDGAKFFGWQSQIHRKTVQDELERALYKFTKTNITIISAGRTDSGVHGLGQVIHFDTKLNRSLFSWVTGINSFLSSAISVQWAQFVPDIFHARFSAYERTYLYVIYVCSVRSPMLVGRAAWMHVPINIHAMQQASLCLIGEHDFSAFRSTGCQSYSSIKTLYEVDIISKDSFIYFRFCANSFLRRMVRNLIGCLVAIGREKYSICWLKKVLKSRNRSYAAPTFNSEGLYLAQIKYPIKFQIPTPDIKNISWKDIL